MIIIFVCFSVLASVYSQRSSDIVYLTGYVNPTRQRVPISGTIGSRIPLSIKDQYYERPKNWNYNTYRNPDVSYGEDYDIATRAHGVYEDFYRYPDVDYNKYHLGSRRSSQLNRNGRYYSTQLRLAKSYDFNKHNPIRDSDDFIKYRKRRHSDGTFQKNVSSTLQEKVADFNKYNTDARDQEDYVHYRKRRSTDSSTADGVQVLQENRVQETRELIYYAPNAKDHSQISQSFQVGSPTPLQEPIDAVLKPIYPSSTASNLTPNGIQAFKKYMYQTDVSKADDPLPPEVVSPETNFEYPNNLIRPVGIRYTSSITTNSTKNVETLTRKDNVETGRSFMIRNEPIRFNSEEDEILLHSSVDYSKSLVPDQINLHLEEFEVVPLSNIPPGAVQHNPLTHEGLQQASLVLEMERFPPQAPPVQVPLHEIQLPEEQTPLSQAPLPSLATFIKPTKNTFDYPTNIIPDEIVPLSVPPTDAAVLPEGQTEEMAKQYVPKKRFIKRTRKAKLAEFGN